jgi:NarL family two-component system response regulator YdfI
MPVIRLLIVAPYAAVRAGLHALLADAEGCAVIGAVGGSAELEALLADTRPDVALLAGDETESLLAGDGSRVVALLSAGQVGMVVLGGDPRTGTALAGAALPGWACLLKDADAEEVAASVRAVAAGLVVLDRRLAPLLADAFARPPRPHPTIPDEALTAREREVLQLMAEGLQNRQIAARLYLSPHTVKFHVASILSKLGAASRTEAVIQAARRGELSL